MKVVSTEKAPAAIGPYSQAIITNGFVFASGQIPIIPESGALAEGLEAQAHQVFKNVTELLRAAGTEISRTVKTTVFIKDMNDFAAINAVYSQYFSTPFPARSCVEIARLPKDVLLECEVVAEI